MSTPNVPKLFEPIHEKIIVRSKIRKWAYENAYTLIVLAGFFVLTWLLMVYLAWS